MRIEEELKSKFRNDYHKALVNLYYTNMLVGEQFHFILKEHGLAAAQFNVLRILKGQSPNTTSLKIIRERMIDKNSGVSRIVDRLLKKGLVERTESKTDRRLKDVLITTKGIQLLEKLKIFENTEDDILSGLNQKEINVLNSLLDKIRIQFN